MPGESIGWLTGGRWGLVAVASAWRCELLNGIQALWCMVIISVKLAGRLATQAVVGPQIQRNMPIQLVKAEIPRSQC